MQICLVPFKVTLCRESAQKSTTKFNSFATFNRILANLKIWGQCNFNSNSLDIIMSPRNQSRNKKSICGYLLLISCTIIFILVQYKLPLNADTQRKLNFHKGLQKFGWEGFPMYPNKPWKLIDINIQYLINNLVCNNIKNTSSEIEYNNSSSVLILILITSHAGDVKIRQKIRQILPQNELTRMKMRRLFLLAKPSKKNLKNSKYKPITLTEIYEESEQFEDILMGDFVESYHNLTYKHLMGLEWSTRYCTQATFVLKQDDDIIVDYYQLSLLLQISEFWLPLVKHKSIFGKVLARQMVIRDPKSKWFVPKQELLDDVFPAFVSGWAYVTTITVIKELVSASSKFKYFWIDDVHITGTLRNYANVTLIDMDQYFTTYKGHLICCISTSVYSKSKSNQPYWCDYIVGPSNDDLQLLEIFQNHSRFCHTTKTCLRREGKDSLNTSCVITDKMVVNNFNYVRKTSSISSRGIWKPYKM